MDSTCIETDERTYENAGFVRLSRKGGRFYVSLYEGQASRRYGKKMRMRRAYTKLVEDWHMVGGIMHDTWSVRDPQASGAGFRTFISINMKLQAHGEPLELFRSHGMGGLAGMKAVSGPLHGGITVTFEAGAAGGGYLSVFAQRISSGIAAGLMQRFDCGPAVRSSVILPGLEAGENYFLYAVVSDREYPAARFVSSSLSCRGIAAGL